MRVALLCPLFESVPPQYYGGTERMVHYLARGLTEAGIEVTLYASADSSCEGVELVPTIDRPLRLRKTPVVDPYALNFKMLSDVARRASDFDVIHNHHDYWMLPLSRMVDVPFLSTIHGRMDLQSQRTVFPAYADSGYISISDAQREPLPDLNWLRTIYHGIDISGLAFQRKAGGYLAFLGRIGDEKRPEWAIQLAKESGVPLKIAAKIEGREGQDYYDTWVKPHVDGKFIEYVGEISEGEKSEFLGNALALAFPIDWPEPFGLVVIESLACGTPVLTRPCGSLPEITRDGVTGFSELNIKRLSARVQDIPKIDRAGCRKWVEENFSLKRMTEDYIHVYRNLVESSTARTHTRQRLQSHRSRRDLLYPFERVAHRHS